MSGALKYRSLRGMPDILPAEMAVRRWVEDTARDVFRTFGYGEIRTPFLEETDVFTRSIGEETDIVQKEMYSLTDRGGTNISLRPEGTASIVRAYIEHGLHHKEGLVKLFYAGPMFRGERPQKGRLRQFYQIGAEIIGASGPYIDAEIIFNLDVLLKQLKVDGFTILLNSLGCARDRAAFKKALSDYLAGKMPALCDNCKRRAGTNILRVLDCKREGCRATLGEAPDILDYLCGACSGDYAALKSILSEMGVPFRQRKDLVRGLDYYTGTVFEVVHPSLGAQDAIAAGGRYDELVKQMGGPDVGATGYGIGIERLLLAIDVKDIPPGLAGALVIPVGDEFRPDAFRITSGLRIKGVPCEMDHSGRSFKGQMRKAHRDRRKFVIMVGEEEIKSEKLLLKDMETGEQKALSFEDVAQRLKGVLKSDV